MSRKDRKLEQWAIGAEEERVSPEFCRTLILLSVDTFQIKADPTQLVEETASGFKEANVADDGEELKGFSHAGYSIQIPQQECHQLELTKKDVTLRVPCNIFIAMATVEDDASQGVIGDDFISPKRSVGSFSLSLKDEIVCGTIHGEQIPWEPEIAQITALG
jgi:hypothetical protein